MWVIFQARARFLWARSNSSIEQLFCFVFRTSLPWRGLYISRLKLWFSGTAGQRLRQLHCRRKTLILWTKRPKDLFHCLPNQTLWSPPKTRHHGPAPIKTHSQNMRVQLRSFFRICRRQKHFGEQHTELVLSIEFYANLTTLFPLREEKAIYFLNLQYNKEQNIH